MNFGMTLASLAALLAAAIVGWCVLYPALLIMDAPRWLLSVSSLVTLEGVWFFSSFAALLVYSTLYRLLPRKRVYDYIIIHGAGLMPDGTPTPLLRGAHGGPFHHDHGESSFFEGDHGCAQRRAIGPRAPWPRLPLRAGHQRLPCVPSQRIRASYRAEGGWGRQPYAWLLLAHGVHPGVHSRYQGAFVAVLCARPAGH